MGGTIYIDFHIGHLPKSRFWLVKAGLRFADATCCKSTWFAGALLVPPTGSEVIGGAP